MSEHSAWFLEARVQGLWDKMGAREGCLQLTFSWLWNGVKGLKKNPGDYRMLSFPSALLNRKSCAQGEAQQDLSPLFALENSSYSNYLSISWASPVSAFLCSLLSQRNILLSSHPWSRLETQILFSFFFSPFPSPFFLHFLFYVQKTNFQKLRGGE